MRGRAVPSFPLVCMLADANLLAVCLSHAWLQAICKSCNPKFTQVHVLTCTDQSVRSNASHDFVQQAWASQIDLILSC